MQLITTSRPQEITATLSEGCDSGLPTPTRGLNFMWPVHAGSMNGGAGSSPPFAPWLHVRINGSWKKPVPGT